MSFEFTQKEKDAAVESGLSDCQCNLCTSGRLMKRLADYYMSIGAETAATSLIAGHDCMLDAMEEDGTVPRPETRENMREWLPKTPTC